MQISFTGVLFPGAGFIELAFEAAILGNKIQPLIIRNVRFKSPLALNESMICKIRCTKKTSNDGGYDKFEVTHVTGQGEHILSTAEIMTVDRDHSDKTFNFSDACKCTLNF